MTVPHLALPLRVTGTGRFATVEQGSSSEIAQNVALVLATPAGSRVEVPEFGSPRSEFTGPDLPGMAAAVEEWEPRADLTAEILTPVLGAETVTQVKAIVSPHV